MKNKPLIIAISIVVIIIGGFLIAGAMNNSNQATQKGLPNATEPATQQDETMTDETPESSDSVIIEKYAFSPATITVKKGTTVTWTNNDTAQHNIEFDEAPANGEQEGPLLGKGENYSFTFDTAGTFSYFCSPHPYMKGTVTVTE